MLNYIAIMGRLTRDPELRRTQNGTAVCSFSIACERDFKDDSGNRETDFIECVAWKGHAEFIEKYFRKGSLACVTGRLQMRSWKDKDGNNRRTAEILVEHCYFAEAKKDGVQKAAAPDVAAPDAGDFAMLEYDDAGLPF